MRHPILDGSGYKFYTLVWMLISIAHGIILFQFYEYSLSISAADSLVHNLLFAAIVPGFWYIIRYANLGEKDIFSLFATHFVAAFFVILGWTLSSEYILKLLFFDEEGYLSFLAETDIQRMILGVLYYCMSMLLLYLIKYYLDLQERSGKELELQTLLKDSELKMLKSQINPHFIFNSLNSISALTMSKPETAREMVIKLSDFLRYSIGKDSIEMNPLQQEIQNASLYLDIEKVRFGSKLVFETEVTDECKKTNVPNLILQPLIENAIKHGVYESVDQVTIQLLCQPYEDMLYISVINNFDRDAVSPKGEGIGLENVRKRLTLVYGRNDLLQLEEKDDKFIAILKIPTNPDQND